MHTNVQKITPTIDVGIKKTEIEVVTASPGENVMFTCQIPKEASDQLVFQWLHDGKIIQQGSKKVIFLFLLHFFWQFWLRKCCVRLFR